MDSEKKILHSYWFTEYGATKPIGVVVVDVPYKGVVAYIGTGIGANQEDDERRILERGAKLHGVVLEDILNSLD